MMGKRDLLKILKAARKYFPNSKITIEKDLSKRDRFVFIINLKLITKNN